MRTIVEMAYIALGLAVTAAMVWAASWAYPLGREVFWWCGAAAMVATLLMGAQALRRARAQDRGQF